MGYLPRRRFSQTSPGKNDNLHLVAATSTVRGSGSIGLSLVSQGRPPVHGLICGFCSSARNFALRWTFQPPQSGFLQIPPHDGHPCLWLTVPATESVVDFHHQVVAHAGRTRKSRLRSLRNRPEELIDPIQNKMLYLAMMDITKKWTSRRMDWSRIHAQLAVYFADRMPD